MLRYLTFIAAVLCFGATPSPAAAQTEPPAPASAGEPPRVGDEIVVTRKRLNVLEKEVHRAQDDLYKAFNENNDDHELDMHCYREVPMNSHISRRVCRPVFVDTATANAAKGFMWYLKSQCPDARDTACISAAVDVGGTEAQGAFGNLTFMARRLDEAMQRLIRENAEVRRAAAIYQQKQREYDEALGNRGK